MTPETRDKLIRIQQSQDLELLAAKGADYTGDDALSNLREYGTLGIMVRLSDKMARLKQLIGTGKEPSVKIESIIDTVRDARNYLHLLQVMLDEKWPGQGTEEK